MLLITLTALAAVLRFWRIGHQGFWFDEANTAQLVHFSPGKMLRLIPQTESTPPLYYCVAWVWARVFGYTEAPLRSLSALIGVALVPVAYLTGAKLISRRAGVIVGALVACNPLLIWYSQEARSYEMLAFLASASLLAFVYALEEPTPRVLAAWVVSSALALATHYYAVLIVVPEAAWLLAAYWWRRPVRIGVALVALCGLGLMFLALSQNSTGRDRWISTAPLSRRLGQVIPQFVVGFEGPARSVVEPLGIALVLLALVLLATRSIPRERRGALLAGALAFAGLLIALLLIALGFDGLITRNLLALWLPAALLVAGGLAAPRAQRLGLATALGLCAIGIVTTVGVAFDRNYQRPEWRVVASALGPHPANHGARAILIQHYRFLLPLSLYVADLKDMPRAGARVSELDIVSFTDPRSNGFCWWGSACNLWPSVMQHTYRVRGFRELSRGHALQFTILRLVSSNPVRLTPHAVSRALTRTHYANDELLIAH